MSVMELGTLEAMLGTFGTSEPEPVAWTGPQFSDVVLERLAPWLTPQTDPYGDHAAFLTAVAAMGQSLWGLAMDSGDDPDDPAWVPGWGALFDVDKCPFAYLPFLAQLVGVPASAIVGVDDTTARGIIRAEQGMQRGTPAAIVAAAQRFLSGTQSCVLLERVNSAGGVDAYRFVLVVRPEELANEAGLIAAVNMVKPGGLQWDLVQTDGWTITEMEGAYATVTALEAGFSTLAALEEDQA